MLDPERHPLECQRLVVRLERPGRRRPEGQREDGGCKNELHVNISCRTKLCACDL